MTGPDDTPQDFPDVGLSKGRALTAFIALCVVFCIIAAWLLPFRGDGLKEHAASLVLAVFLLALSYVDLRSGLLPDLMTLPLIALGLAYATVSHLSVWLAIAGAVVGYGTVAILAAYWRRARGREGIGLGDAKLLAAGGAWLGITALPFVLLIASTAGILVALSVAGMSRKALNQTALPFGPCLAIGIWIVWCARMWLPI